MFRLYGNIKGWQLLMYSQNEEKIIDMLENSISECKSINYLIIKNENNGDIPYKVILSEQDYYDYVMEFRNKDIAKVKKK